MTRSCTSWWIAVVMRLSTLLFFLSTTLLGVRAVPVDITFTSTQPSNTYTPPSNWNQIVGSFVVTDSDPNEKYHALRVHGGPDKDVFNVNDFDLRITKAGQGKSTLTVCSSSQVPGDDRYKEMNSSCPSLFFVYFQIFHMSCRVCRLLAYL